MHGKYTTRREAEFAVLEYIEVFYNRQRIQKRLGYLSPAMFEQKFLAEQNNTRGLVSTLDDLPQIPESASDRHTVLTGRSNNFARIGLKNGIRASPLRSFTLVF
ncbi:MAG: IS3 family transposase [Desulfobulbaceae bacterium]|nr:IS3 family transposase [Desulfobulbaceae bacterium]